MDSHIPVTTQPLTFIFVPGFPGEAISRNENEIRVVDIVSKVVENSGKKLEIVHYPGILNSDDFSFEQTKSFTFEVIRKKIDAGFSVRLIGQSWGGLISLMASCVYPVDQILLITPFLLIPDNVTLHNIICFYAKEFPALIPQKKISQAFSHICTMRDELQTLDYSKITANKISILVSTKDDVVPCDLIKKYLGALLLNNITISETLNDHDFSYGKQDLEYWLEKNV